MLEMNETVRHPSRWETTRPVQSEANCVSMTEIKNRKKPSSTRMLARPPDLIVSTRIATTKTSSMDHLPMFDTKWNNRRACSTARCGHNHNTSMALIFTNGKMTVNTNKIRNRNNSPACHKMINTRYTEI